MAAAGDSTTRMSQLLRADLNGGGRLRVDSSSLVRSRGAEQPSAAWPRAPACVRARTAPASPQLRLGIQHVTSCGAPDQRQRLCGGRLAHGASSSLLGLHYFEESGAIRMNKLLFGQSAVKSIRRFRPNRRKTCIPPLLCFSSDQLPSTSAQPSQPPRPSRIRPSAARLHSLPKRLPPSARRTSCPGTPQALEFSV